MADNDYISWLLEGQAAWNKRRELHDFSPRFSFVDFADVFRQADISTHTLRHSYARHLLMNGIPINYLSRWLGHSSIQTTLIYLELVPDPTGSLAMVP